MSKILVAYASKSGTAKEAAEEIVSLLPDSDLVDLMKDTPSLDGYEAAIIGGGVRMGAVPKETQRFIQANEAKLGAMPVAFFITNCFIDSADEIIGKMLPAALKDHALFAGTVGGRLDVTKLKGVEKMIAKTVSKSVDEGQRVADGIDEEALQALVASFK